MRISDWSSDVCSSDLHLRQMRGVEAHRRRAVIVAAERDMVDADEVADMLHRLRDARGRGVADRGVPIADADQAAGRGDPADFGGGEGAVDLARRLHPAVAGDHRARSEEHPSEIQSLMRISY